MLIFEPPDSGEGKFVMFEKKTAFDERETNRTEAFSDGVFSIAITLLVLGIKVPQIKDLSSGQSLLQAFAAQWPSFLSFLISFFTIFIMWVQHHRLFTLIKRVDLPFMYLNGFLLLIVTFVPFPTAILAEHIQHANAKTAAMLYTGTYVFIGIAYNLVWHYAAYKRRLIGARVPQKAVEEVTRQYYLGPSVFFASFVLTYFHVTAGLCLCVALDIFFALTANPVKSRESADEKPS